MKIFNTLTRQKEEFKPITPGRAKIYACGPTVYNFIHIGNARPICVFDTLRRYLEYRGYKVTFVQNFTDVDDKIIRKANEEGVDYTEITEKYIKEFWTDVKGLNFREADIHPKATENIEKIIEIVSGLVEKGYAYEVDGDVYFSPAKFEGYGKLSHQPLEQSPASPTGIRPGARADPAGISSARQWSTDSSATQSTFTAAVRISFSPTTKTRLPRASATQADLSPITGCTTALSPLTM